MKLLILEPRERGRAQAVAQDDLLDGENSLEHGDIHPRAVKAVGAPVHPSFGAEPPKQSRRELEGRIGEDRVTQELQAVALLGAGDRYDRVSGVFIGLVIARDRLTSDILRCQVGTVAPLLQ